MRRILAVILACVFTSVIASTAWAANYHFVSASASGPDNKGNLPVSFKMAGLDGNQSLTITATSDANALYACRNNGGNFPTDPKKQAETGPVSDSGQFTSGKNGQITGRLTLSPPKTTLSCPPGQKPVLANVTYNNVTVSAPDGNGGTLTETIGGPFSKTFYNV